MVTHSNVTAPPLAFRNTQLRDDGVYEAADTPVERLTWGQRVFFNDLSARLYVISREGSFARFMNGHDSVEDYPRLVRSLELDDDSTVLDVPCGQGNVTEALAHAVPRGRVIGLDLSNTMLRLARRRLDRAGLLERATLLRANAQQLPLEDASVDAISRARDSTCSRIPTARSPRCAACCGPVAASPASCSSSRLNRCAGWSRPR